MAMNSTGRGETRPHADTAVGQTATFTGNRGLQIEEALIFEQGQPGRTAVDLPELPTTAIRLGGVKPRRAIGLPGLSEPQVIRHYTRLSQKN